MIPPEIADLRDVLLAIPVTNSETQATKWAWMVADAMKAKGWAIDHDPMGDA
jgi:hypothetical protein